MRPTQRKFKLLKRRELSPPIAMKFFHIVKWVSGGFKYIYLMFIAELNPLKGTS